jgi:hypothetical protein
LIGSAQCWANDGQPIAWGSAQNWIGKKLLGSVGQMTAGGQLHPQSFSLRQRRSL